MNRFKPITMEFLDWMKNDISDKLKNMYDPSKPLSVELDNPILYAFITLLNNIAPFHMLPPIGAMYTYHFFEQMSRKPLKKVNAQDLFNFLKRHGPIIQPTDLSNYVLRATYKSVREHRTSLAASERKRKQIISRGDIPVLGIPSLAMNICELSRSVLQKYAPKLKKRFPKQFDSKATIEELIDFEMLCGTGAVYATHDLLFDK